MRIKHLTLIGLLFLSSSIFSQEIGSIKNGNHSIKILKTNQTSYACVYSDVSSKVSQDEKSFLFSDKNEIYKILINGFSSNKSHQIFVQTNETTIVKFDYRRINGIIMLKIRHNNLVSNILGESSFFSKEQIIELFREPTNPKA